MGEQTILVKVHNSYRWVVAICDKELQGTMIEEGNKQLDLTGTFFQGTPMNEEETITEIQRCIEEDANFNIIGTNSIKAAIKAGIINTDGVMTINNTPYALALL